MKTESGRWDSNPRPPAPKAGTTGATPHDTVPGTACKGGPTGQQLDSGATPADTAAGQGPDKTWDGHSRVILERDRPREAADYWLRRLADPYTHIGPADRGYIVWAVCKEHERLAERVSTLEGQLRECDHARELLGSQISRDDALGLATPSDTVSAYFVLRDVAAGLGADPATQETTDHVAAEADSAWLTDDLPPELRKLLADPRMAAAEAEPVGTNVGTNVGTSEARQAAIEACPDPRSHEVFCYCPHCPWTEADLFKGESSIGTTTPSPESIGAYFAELKGIQYARAVAEQGDGTIIGSASGVSDHDFGGPGSRGTQETGG